jgi:hypothetical protein
MLASHLVPIWARSLREACRWNGRPCYLAGKPLIYETKDFGECGGLKASGPSPTESGNWGLEQPAALARTRDLTEPD